MEITKVESREIMFAIRQINDRYGGKNTEVSENPQVILERLNDYERVNMELSKDYEVLLCELSEESLNPRVERIPIFNDRDEVSTIPTGNRDEFEWYAPTRLTKYDLEKAIDGF